MLSWFFHPTRVAVIGASRDKKSVGGVLFKNVSQSSTEVFAINPHAARIQGKPAYASIKDVPKKIDLALIAVPAPIVSRVLEECAQKKVRGAVIISAGFSEIGEIEREKEIMRIAKRAKMRILGPNCLGFATSTINATFFKGSIRPGTITLISQSGAVGDSILDMLDGQKQGVRLFVSTGNALDLSNTELITHAGKDMRTKSIGVYLESFKDGRAFLNACKKAKKPVIAIKAGISDAGKKAARSHTGAIASDDRIVSGVFEQYNIKRVDTLRELVQTAQAAALQGVLKGKRVLIITNAGGLGVLSADEIEKNRLELARIDTSRFDPFLPKAWSKQNPIDIVGDANALRYKRVFEEALKQKNCFDAVLVILTPLAMTQTLQTANNLIAFAKQVKKPCYACFVGGKHVKAAIRTLEEQGVPSFYEPQDAISVLGLLS
ncbi:hypothetical protein COT72_02950 [archaeon CG10_big_fil_rev_8_21_14_0_10_43_11]|nr:MAG: hypothetical protein COT72_02950 [archaeon CG10_big_fil_rev_8_21_14_0_10_43_11]